MEKIELNTIVWQDGAHFVAQCLQVDVSSFGATKSEALVNLQEALELYFEDASPAELPTVINPEIVITILARA